MSKKTNVAFLLDETGSMESCKKDTVGGFNNFLSDQKKKGNNVSFSLTLFNSSKVEKRYVSESISKVKRLSTDNYHPSNLTPLWDAVGSTINEIGDKKDVLFIILSDGYENSSKEFTSKSVRKLIKDKEKKKGWKFLFLGADLSNFDDSINIGIAMNFKADKLNMGKTYRNISATVSNYCSTGDVDYNDN